VAKSNSPSTLKGGEHITDRFLTFNIRKHNSILELYFCFWGS